MKKPEKKSTHAGMYYDVQEMDAYLKYLAQRTRGVIDAKCAERSGESYYDVKLINDLRVIKNRILGE